MANEIEILLNREIARCVARIAECETREAELALEPNPKLRAANDRDRDRAFIALGRAMKMLRDLPKFESAPKPEAPAQAQPQVQPQAPAAHPQIARNALCPCRSGQKYKRCCGRLAPPLHTATTAAKSTPQLAGRSSTTAFSPPAL